MVDHFGRRVSLEIGDTSGSHSTGIENRAILYEDADVYLVCVAADNPASLDSCSFWVKEIRQV